MAEPVLWGSEISVDLGTTAGWRGDSSAIAFADGSFLVVWADDSGGGDIFGQFFSTDGTHKGEAFLVTSSANGTQGMPQATLLNDGRYVVAWSTTRGTENSEDLGVWARIFDEQGQGGSDLYVGTTGFFGMPAPSISALGNGFVVSYAYANFLSPQNAYARAFNADGVPITSGIRVNGTGGSASGGSDLVELDNDQYAVFFDGEGYAGDPDGDVRCRVFSANGERSCLNFGCRPMSAALNGIPVLPA